MAEGIVKSIFGLESKSLGSGMGTTMAVMGVAQYFSPSNKPKTPPSNVDTKKSDGKNPSATPKSNSMVATNNLNQSNEPQDKNSKPASGQEPKNVPTKKSESEQLADRMLNPQVQAADYYDTMSDKTQADRIADAEASDYDELMGNNDDTLDSGVSNTGSTVSSPTEPVVTGEVASPRAESTSTTSNTASDNSKPAEQTVKPGRIDPTIKMPEVTNNNRSLLKMTGSVLKGAGSIAKDVVIGGNKIAAKAGGAIVGTTFAGLQGADASKMIGAALLGKNIQDSAVNKAKEGKDKIQETISGVKIKNDEKTLATAFSNYKNGRDYDRGTDINQARNYLNMDSNKIKDIKDKSERQYVQALHAMRNIYNEDKYNDADSNERVIETMEKIVNEEIQPKNY